MIKKSGLILFMLLAGLLLYAADDLFPEIEGWKLSRDDKVYIPDNLWELINGAAELYLAYDFQDLNLATYSCSKDQEVRVELYRHSTRENTYGIYSAERMPDYHFIDIGIQGYTGPGILHFFTGCYYIKVLSVGSGDVGEESLVSIAGRVSQVLDQSGSWPSEINLFPAEGKVVMSDGYVATNFMGYSFFHSAFTARYEAGGEFILFVIHGKAGEAEAMLEKYKGLIKEDKIDQKGDIMLIQDMFNGKVYLSLKGDYLVGVLNAGSGSVAEEYIGKVRGNIEKGNQK